MVVMLTCAPSSSGSGDLLKLPDRSRETIIVLFLPLLALLAAILDLSVTTTPLLPSRHVTSSCIRSIAPASDVIKSKMAARGKT